MSRVSTVVNTNTETVATYLRELRDTTSQRALASRIGSTDAAIAHVETGNRVISQDMANRIADALGLADEQRAKLHYLRVMDQADRHRSKAVRELVRFETELANYARAAGLMPPDARIPGDEEAELDVEIRLLEEQVAALRAARLEAQPPAGASTGSPRRARR